MRIMITLKDKIKLKDRFINLISSFIKIIDSLIYILTFTIIYTSFDFDFIIYINKKKFEKNNKENR
jgi:hypothetical protein